MVMRIGGLASGMDIDSIVEKLMSAERAPYNKLLQNKQKYEWQRDSYRDVNTNLKAFDDYLFNDMTLQKDFFKKSVVSTNSAVSAVPTTAATGQTLTIDSVDQLAKAGNAKGQLAAGTAGSATLESLGVVASGQTKDVSMKVLQTDGTMKDVNLQFSSEDSIDSVIAKLKKDTGLNAFYDSKSGQISLATQATGKADSYEMTKITEDENGYEITDIMISNASVYVSTGEDFFTSLGFTNNSALIGNGQNAKITINGAQIERQSNSFEIDGMKLTLNNTYSSINGQPIDLSTKVDADNMVDKIKKFVDTYNGLIDTMSGLVKEPKYRDYTPLTDEQKEEMSEKEIESWEKKAKSGLLRNDQILNSALNTLRATMYTNGGGKQDVRATADQPSQNFINTLYEMGITTSNKTSDRGKLQIDETKLREAIEKDPEQVFKTFSDTTAGNEGLVQKLRKNVQSTIRDIEKKAGKADSTNQSFQIGRSINDAEDRIDAWKTKLANIEERYWKQFTAMEEAINKANSQSSSLFSSQQ
jgi:flagellar hook-associated protein 2